MYVVSFAVRLPFVKAKLALTLQANLKSEPVVLAIDKPANGSTLVKPHHGPELPQYKPVKQQQASRDKILPGQRAASASSLKQPDALSADKALPKPKALIAANQLPSPVVQKAPPASTARINKAPADFDWQTYLLYNPELRDAGIGSQQQAEQHYIQTGYSQGLMYKRLRVILRYTACTGLINQHYSHIAAFSLSAVLGAELVLPPAVKRDSFAHYFSVFKEHNEVKWTPAPLESLLNVDKIVDFWQGRGLTVHRVIHHLLLLVLYTHNRFSVIASSK